MQVKLNDQSEERAKKEDPTVHSSEDEKSPDRERN